MEIRIAKISFFGEQKNLHEKNHEGYLFFLFIKKTIKYLLVVKVSTSD